MTEKKAVSAATEKDRETKALAREKTPERTVGTK
jgi:hypothetical protein